MTERFGNSWDISSAILGHKYHQNHSNRSSEWRQHLQQKWLIQSKWVTDISSQEACTVTQKLDVDQMSERNIRILKDTHIYIYDYTHFLLQILDLFISYISGKWLQKEDIAETAVHFVLKWGFEVSPVSNNSSNNSRMLETKDFRDIASAYMPLKRGL